MAQQLEPGRSDNRGGNKPKTSTKKLFFHRVEESKHAELREYAIKLNKEVEGDKGKRYTIHRRMQVLNSAAPSWIDVGFNLSFTEAESEIQLRDTEYSNLPSGLDVSCFKIVEIQITPDPCNTTEN